MIFASTRAAFKQERVYNRAFDLAVNVLLALGKRTITGILSAGGKQFHDWSAAYRLFLKGRINQQKFFAPAILNVMENQPADTPLFVMMDDTLLRKCGRKVAGTSWKRDPLGPKFTTNFVWGQRFLQISAALPDHDVDGRARGIPIDFRHAPSPVKPRKNAGLEVWCEYRKQQKLCRISMAGATCLAELREQIPGEKIVCSVDGGYTNETVFTAIPDNMVIIGRIRKDAKLYRVPEEYIGKSRGRKKYYGEPLPTPEQIRQDDKYLWEKISAFAAGKKHAFEVKSVASVRWKSSKNQDMRIVIIRPLAYRPRKNSKLLYRDPAYLICSDPQLPLEQVVQAYIWRWEIELNFRDEKTIMGVGEAQVRNPLTVQSVPAFIVACYSYLLLADHANKTDSSIIPSPKWYKRKSSDRCSTQKILSIFRSQIWGIELGNNKSGFVSNISKSPQTRSRFFPSISLKSAICYNTK